MSFWRFLRKHKNEKAGLPVKSGWTILISICMKITLFQSAKCERCIIWSFKMRAMKKGRQNRIVTNYRKGHRHVIWRVGERVDKPYFTKNFILILSPSPVPPCRLGSRLGQRWTTATGSHRHGGAAMKFFADFTPFSARYCDIAVRARRRSYGRRAINSKQYLAENRLFRQSDRHAKWRVGALSAVGAYFVFLVAELKIKSAYCKNTEFTL